MLSFNWPYDLLAGNANPDDCKSCCGIGSESIWMGIYVHGKATPYGPETPVIVPTIDFDEVLTMLTVLLLLFPIYAYAPFGEKATPNELYMWKPVIVPTMEFDEVLTMLTEVLP